MAGTYNTAAADYAFNMIFPALINKIEWKATGESVSQWANLGDLEAGAELTCAPVSQPLSGNRSAQIGYKVDFKGILVITGVNMRTAINTLIGTATDVRLTDISGHTWTFLSTEFTPNVGEEIKGDGENGGKFNITGSGRLTNTRFAAIFSLT